MAVPNFEDDARTLHDRLKEIFTASPPGRDDGAALREVRHLCLNAGRRIDDPHCHAQLRQLERYARFYFSRQAHEQWARDTGFGGAGLRTLILQCLSGIELRLSHLEAEQRPAATAAQAGARPAALAPR